MSVTATRGPQGGAVEDVVEAWSTRSRISRGNQARATAPGEGKDRHADE